jgi:hypothetical protein
MLMKSISLTEAALNYALVFGVNAVIVPEKWHEPRFGDEWFKSRTAQALRLLAAMQVSDVVAHGYTVQSLYTHMIVRGGVAPVAAASALRGCNGPHGACVRAVLAISEAHALPVATLQQLKPAALPALRPLVFAHYARFMAGVVFVDALILQPLARRF